MATEENGFLEYLQLQGGEPDLVTKSELMQQVREQGYPISDRQLTFYVSEGLLPRSVRVGSRAGAYPEIVVELLQWLLRSRDGGVPIESLKELLPVWKFLIRARGAGRLDLGEFEYVARQHVRSTEGSLAVVRLVTEVFTANCCPVCRDDVIVVRKNGEEVSINDPHSTIGFALARNVEDEQGKTEPHWYATTRISLAHALADATDPTTVVLGLRPNDPLPPAFRMQAHPTTDKEAANVDA